MTRQVPPAQSRDFGICLPASGRAADGTAAEVGGITDSGTPGSTGCLRDGVTGARGTVGAVAGAVTAAGLGGGETGSAVPRNLLPRSLALCGLSAGFFAKHAATVRSQCSGICTVDAIPRSWRRTAIGIAVLSRI